MGNGKSQPVELLIEDTNVKSGNFWTLHPATYGSQISKRATVFVSPIDTSNSVSALEKFSKNLMLYRHPNILKYISSWKVNGQYHMVTEEVQPLNQVINSLTPLQICIGLHGILKALNFLHSKAHCSHNNICEAAVFITTEGHWKLGGLDHLCKFKNITSEFLTNSRTCRYERGISPNEYKKVPNPVSAIDHYAFGIFVEEILMKIQDKIDGMDEFVQLCKNNLQASECASPIPFNQILEHSFFSNEFVKVYNFLSELPLKMEEEKKDFFSSLIKNLKEYDEELIARQLGGLLVSRLVLLDSTAQELVLPKILIPRSETQQDSLFSEETFRLEMVPRLLSIFLVRDLQVRMTLLSYFSFFCCSFTLHQLQSILPEILLGIKDVNNDLVAATLRALADLVPILGSSTVIGGKRMKIFSDGRPKAHKKANCAQERVQDSILSTEGMENGSAEEGSLVLSERRPSPDGGEETMSVASVQDEEETWLNWDSPNTPVQEQVVDRSSIVPVASSEYSDTNSGNFPNLDKLDLKSLEVKSPSSTPEDVDFFLDMEPVISKPKVIELTSKETSSETNRLGLLQQSNEVEAEGWGDDLEWAEM